MILRLAAFLVAIISLRVAVAVTLPVLHEEAYYWEWSQHLDWGYVEHPPVVAWMIHVTTSLVGQTSPLAIRLGALVAGVLTAAAAWLLAWQLFRDRSVANWTLALTVCLPIFNAVGVLALPAAAMLLFYVVFLLCFWRAVQGGRWAWVLAGAAAGLGLMCKLSAGVALLAAATFLVLSPPHRHWLKRVEPWLAALTTLLVTSAYLGWDYRHGWTSLSYHWWCVTKAGFIPDAGQLGEFLFEQIVNTGIFLFLPIAASPFFRLAHLPDDWHRPFLFIKIQAITIGTIFLVSACIVETHPNTTLLMYPGAVICTAALACHAVAWAGVQRLTLLFRLSAVTLPLAAGLLCLGMDHFQTVDFGPWSRELSQKATLARHRLFGWSVVADRVDRERNRYFPDGNARLFTHDFELASLTSFHGTGELIVNLVPLVLSDHVVGTAQEHYISSSEVIGRSGLYFGNEDGPSVEGLRTVFEAVEELPPIEIYHEGQLIKRYRLCKVTCLKHGVLNSR